MLPDEGPIFPKDEPEIRRLKAAQYARQLNEESRRPYQNASIGLETASTAYEVLGLRYEPTARLRASGIQPTPETVLAACPPSRFTWFCDQEGAAQNCMKVRDDQTGRVAVWPFF
jgi:hypothetical protein